MNRKSNQVIKSTFVLGSTSAIAMVVCNELAIKGCNKFYLVARNLEKNKLLANQLRKKFNANVVTKEIDLENEKSINEIANINNYDLYLIATGYIGDSKKAIYSYSEAKKITFSNYLGILPFISEILKDINMNHHTRIWILSSVAGDKGRPSNHYYGAAKAALNIFCEGLFYKYRETKVSIRVIKGGYVLSPMTLGKVPKKLCITPKNFAKKLISNPNKRGFEYIPGWWKIIIFFVKIMPGRFISKL